MRKKQDVIWEPPGTVFSGILSVPVVCFILWHGKQKAQESEAYSFS